MVLGVRVQARRLPLLQEREPLGVSRRTQLDLRDKEAQRARRGPRRVEQFWWQQLGWREQREGWVAV